MAMAQSVKSLIETTLRHSNGLPVEALIVDTCIGGVAEASGDAALLIGPGDAEAAARALMRIAAEQDLRARLVSHGLRLAAAHTVEREAAAVAAFLTDAAYASDRDRTP